MHLGFALLFRQRDRQNALHEGRAWQSRQGSGLFSSKH